MNPVNEKVAASKVEIIRRMLDGIEDLPLSAEQSFVNDFLAVCAGESMLRRALEALLDLGRHVAAKGFAEPVVEYKQIGRALGRRGVLSGDTAALLVEMAGYRNRLTHFYDEVTPEELFQILTTRTGDIETVLNEILAWIRSHPESVENQL